MSSSNIPRASRVIADNEALYANPYVHVDIIQDAVTHCLRVMVAPDIGAVRPLARACVFRLTYRRSPWYRHGWARFVRWLRSRGCPMPKTLVDIATTYVPHRGYHTIDLPDETIARVVLQCQMLRHDGIEPTMVLCGKGAFSTIRFDPAPFAQAPRIEFRGLKLQYSRWLADDAVVVA